MKKAKLQFIEAHRGMWSVSAMCRVLKVTRQGRYQRASRPVSAHDERDFEIAAVLIPLLERLDSCYGAPKMLVELRKAGVRTSKKRVARLMSEYGMAGTCGVGLRKPGAPKDKPETDDADDLADREFEADGPNRAWFADIAYVKTYQGWLYVAVVIDIWSRMVVGWAMGPRIDAALADDALRMAITRRRPSSGLIHHSGSQRTSRLLARWADGHEVRLSVGRTGSCHDNAVAESFFGTLKNEMYSLRKWPTREEARNAVIDYIERRYNRNRPHSTIGYQVPAKAMEAFFERTKPAAEDAAAKPACAERMAA